MGFYAGNLPRKFISFHCLKIDPNEKDGRNTEGVENIANFPQASNSETENPPSKIFVAMQFAAVSDLVSKDNVNVVAEDVKIENQECLLSCSDKRGVALEMFFMKSWIFSVENGWRKS